MPIQTTIVQDDDLGKLIRDNISLAIDGSLILIWAEENFDPGDIFSESALRAWALGNGFIENE